jgi:hypothetical protein
MPQALIDITILRTDVWSDAVGETTEQDRLRAHRVVEHICRRFPAVRYDDRRGPHSEVPATRRPAERRATGDVATTGVAAAWPTTADV